LSIARLISSNDRIDTDHAPQQFAGSCLSACESVQTFPSFFSTPALPHRTSIKLWSVARFSCAAGTIRVAAQTIARRNARQALRQGKIQNATAQRRTVTFLHGSYVHVLHRKNRVGVVTYRHSEAQHLKNAWTRAPIVKALWIFFERTHSCHTALRARIRDADSKPCLIAHRHGPHGDVTIALFAAALLNQFRCETKTLVYFLTRSRRPAVLTISAIEGHGTGRQASAVWMSATLSQRWSGGDS
jgi:hypothetical protein